MSRMKEYFIEERERMDNGMVTIRVPTRITDQATLELLARELVAQAEQSVDPQEVELPVEAAPEPEPKRAWQPPIRPPYEKRLKRLRLWMLSWIQTACVSQHGANSLTQAWSALANRAGVYWVNLPGRAWSMLTTITSKRESPDEKTARDAICAACPSRVYRLRRTKDTVVLDEHCGKCGCPDWKLSRNVVRNWYTAWNCPERRHAGPYPDDDLRAKLEGEGYDPKVVFAVGGGCTGCGCGKAKQG